MSFNRNLFRCISIFKNESIATIQHTYHSFLRSGNIWIQLQNVCLDFKRAPIKLLFHVSR